MGEYITQIYHQLKGSLYPSVISWNALYGIVCILIIILIIKRYIPRVLRIICALLGFILAMELCHVIVFETGLGNAVPFLKTIFRYTVLSGLAQLCVGTPIADGLLWAQAAVTGCFLKIYHGIAGWFVH